MPNLDITINLEYDGDLNRDAFMKHLVSEINGYDLASYLNPEIEITSLTVEANGDD